LGLLKLLCLIEAVSHCNHDFIASFPSGYIFLDHLQEVVLYLLSVFVDLAAFLVRMCGHVFIKVMRKVFKLFIKLPQKPLPLLRVVIIILLVHPNLQVVVLRLQLFKLLPVLHHVLVARLNISQTFVLPDAVSCHLVESVP